MLKRDKREEEDDGNDGMRRMKQRRIAKLGDDDNETGVLKDKGNGNAAVVDDDNDDNDGDQGDQDENEDQQDADDDDDDNEEENEKFEYNDDEDKQEESERMIALLNKFTPEQLERYEHFRRSHLVKSQVKSIMEKVLLNIFQSQKRNEDNAPITISDKLLIVMGGISKMYAGELVENARIVMEDREEIGVIQPRHLREAFRRMKRDGKITYLQS